MCIGSQSVNPAKQKISQMIGQSMGANTPSVRKPSPNPRQNFKPKTQKVEGQEFQTWNKNEIFPKAKANQLMDRAQSAFVRQPPQSNNLAGSKFIGSGRSPNK